MNKVNIKIKKGECPPNQIADNLKVDLREDLNAKKRQPFKRWLFLFIALFLLVLIFTVCQNTFFSDKTSFNRLIPKEAVVFGLIDQASLYNQTAPFYGLLRENNFYGQNALSKIGGYFNQANLDIQNDFQPLFKQEAAFILMPSNSETSFPFAVIFKKNQPSSEVERILSKIEPKLKEDYNFSTEKYRQIKTTFLRPISFISDGLPDLYAYAQIDGYFIISNSKQTIEAFIDSIID